MTIDGSTICSIIQSFPVLLILAQNSNKCLHTPFVYKPPHPTHSPEYYEAYDALLQTLLHDNNCHDYQYGVPSYGHGYKKCYNHYPVHNFPVDSHYPAEGHYPVYGQGHSNHDFGYQYPSFEGHYISKNGFNKTSYVYSRNYAPNQVHNVKRKYKIVVKGSKRLQKLRLRGFFPTREERRYPSTFGFSQNRFLNPSRITSTISKIIQLERENLFSNPAYIFPFQNRPITNPNQNTFSNNVRFPGQDQTQFLNPDQPNNYGYPGNSANVPSNTGFDNNNPGFTNGGELTSGQHNGPVFGSDLSNIGNGGTDILQSGQQTGSAFGDGVPNGSSGNFIPGQQNAPVFGTGLPNFNNRVPDSLVPGQQTGPVSNQDLPSTDNGSTLVSGQNNVPTFSTEAPSFENNSTNALIPGQQTGTIFGSNIQNGESTLVSGENIGNGFSTKAPNFVNGGTGSLNAGSQTGPTFGHDLPNNDNDGSNLGSGQHYSPTMVSTEAPNYDNSGTGTLVSDQQKGPTFGQDLSNVNIGGSGNLVSGQQNAPISGQDLPNVGIEGSGNLVSGHQNGPAFGQDLPNIGIGGPGNLVSGQQNGPVFGQDLPNFGIGGSGNLVSGQQNGPIFGQDLPNVGIGGAGNLASGQQTGPVFGQDLANVGIGGSGNLVSGQQNEPVFGQDIPNVGIGGSGNLVSGQQNKPVFGQDLPNVGIGGFGKLVSGQQNGPAFDQYLPNVSTGGAGNLVSGQHNGPVFGIESPNKENNGMLITGMHSGPVFDPDSPVPAFESRNDFNLGIFKETCTTVEGGIGSCVSIITCAPYVILLQQAQSNPAAVRQLRAAHCGFEGNNPKVCCPLPAPPTAPPTEAPVGKSLPTSDYITAFPEPPVCGLSNASFSRVVGGVDAKLGDFPWMALLGYRGRRGASTRWLCGGALISQHHILTAAHCIHSREDDLYVVRLGELDLARDDEGATPMDILIKEKIKHEKYNATSFENDIGLLILERDVDFTDLIRPICIPTRSDLRANTFVDYNPLIAGWGDTEFRGPSASHLQVLQLPVLDNSYCTKAYARYTAQKIDERVMCAGFKKGGKDACQGDSGGPLMQPDYNPVKFTTYFYQTGVVSFGRKCAEAGFPGIYTRVTHFVPWLQKQVLGLAE